jgi:outer membrane cobalamin receptor
VSLYSCRLGRLFTFSRFLFATLAIVVSTLSAPPRVSAAMLAGQMTDPDGRAIPAARILIVNALGVVTEAVTDANGAYEIDRLEAGVYEVRVVADGLRTDPVTVTLRADERREVSLRLRLSAIAESIVVSAGQIDLPLSTAADTVTVITSAELEARYVETVADALRYVPGLAVTRSGGRGAITSLFPRGGGSNYTLVLIDGIRANSFGGGYDFGHLSANNIDRIEVVRGPQSGVFGSDATGAVVRVVTRRGGRPRVDGLVEGGGRGTLRSSLGTAGTTGGWMWGAGAERTHSDGFTGRAANGERVSNDDYDLTSVSGTMGRQQPGGSEVFVAAHLSRDERGFPGPFGADPIGVFEGVDRISRGVNNTRQVGGRFAHPWSPRVRQRLEASYTDIAGSFVSVFDPNEPSTSGTRRFDARVQEDVVFTPTIGTSVGVELIGERGTSTFVTGLAGLPVPIQRAVVGSYAELRLVRQDRFFVTGGLRLERLTREAVEPDPISFSPRPAFPGQTINSVNPKIAVSYALRRPGEGRAATRLHVSAGTGMRPPNVFEIAFTDNSDLRPERSRSVDVGIEQQLAGGAYSLAATAFVNRYDDLIITVGRALQDASRYRTDNISNAHARGLELSGEARLLAGLAISAGYTFLATEILSVDGLDRLAPAPFAVGDALIRRPRHQTAATVRYSHARISAFGEWTQRSRTLDLEPNFGSFGGLFFAPGYSTLNAGIGVPFGRGLHVFARALNLMDRQYEETLGYPAPGRSGIVGVRIAARR